MQRRERDVSGNAGDGLDSRIFHKTRICRDFMQGNCPYGDRCRYAHGEHELRKMTSEEQGIFERFGPGPDRGKKVELCKDFQYGRCKYGDTCKYAHIQEGSSRGGGPGQGTGLGLGPGMMMPMGGVPGAGMMAGGGGGGGGGGVPMHNMMNPMMSGMPNMMMNPMAAMGMGAGAMGMNSMGMAAGMGGMPGAMAVGGGGMMPGNQMGMGVPNMAMGSQQGQLPGQPGLGTGMGPGPGQVAVSGPRPDGMAQPGSAHAPVRKANLSSSLLRPPPETRPPPQRNHQPPIASPSKPAPPLPPSSTSTAATTASRANAASAKAPVASPAESLSAISDPSVKAEVAYIERVRATCGVLNIGNAAAFSRDRPDMVAAALGAVRTRAAYRANAYADEVSQYLPQLQAAPSGSARA